MSEEQSSKLNFEEMQNLGDQIKKSWMQDTDKTSEMKILISFLEDISKYPKLENYFENKSELDYFCNSFTQDVIKNILIQPVVYGENGDEIALKLLINFILIFIKNIENNYFNDSVINYYKQILKIFKNDNNYYNSSNKNNCKISNNKKFLDYKFFNKIFNKKFLKKKFENKINNEYKEGDYVDINVKYKKCRSNFDEKNWVRGKIIKILENYYEDNDNMYSGMGGFTSYNYNNFNNFNNNFNYYDGDDINVQNYLNLLNQIFLTKFKYDDNNNNNNNKNIPNENNNDNNNNNENNFFDNENDNQKNKTAKKIALVVF